MKVLKDMVLTVTTQYPPHSIYFFSHSIYSCPLPRMLMASTQFHSIHHIFFGYTVIFFGYTVKVSQPKGHII